MSAEIIAEAAAYRRAAETLERHRQRLAELFCQAREQGIGPTEIEKLVDRLYTKEHISRITTGKTRKSAKRS